MNLVDSLFESINFTFQDNSGKANKLSLDDESDKFCSKSIRPKKLLKVAKSTQNWQKYNGFDIISIAKRKCSYLQRGRQTTCLKLPSNKSANGYLKGVRKINFR